MKLKPKPNQSNYAPISRREFDRIAKKVMRERQGLMKRLAKTP